MCVIENEGFDGKKSGEKRNTVCKTCTRGVLLYFGNGNHDPILL